MAINYVKFQRGTITTYNKLRNKDENTLYFVHPDNDDTKGSLYLGSRLITGDIGTSVSSMADLTDVITNNASTGSFLVLNSDNKWISASIEEVVSLIVESGIDTFSVDEQEFQFHAVNRQLELKGYSTALTGMAPVKTETGLSWQYMPTDLSSQVGRLETNVTNLINGFQQIDSKINEAISGAPFLKYKVISRLSEATKENVIYLFNNLNGVNNSYSEYMLINGKLEKIGEMDVDFNNYITNEQLEQALNNKANISDLNNLNTKVGRLEESIQHIQENYVTINKFKAVIGDTKLIQPYNNLGENASVTETIIDIYERLTWQEINI